MTVLMWASGRCCGTQSHTKVAGLMVAVLTCGLALAGRAAGLAQSACATGRVG